MENGDEYWISGPRKDGADALYATNVQTALDEDVRAEYWSEIRSLPERAYAVGRERMAGMSRKWMWARCALEAAYVLQYIFRVPFFVRVCRYKLHHESLSYNAQWFLGMALGLGTVVLAAWDCRRQWRRLQRMMAAGLAK